MVSTNVVVFPVPGGPNTIYGAGCAELCKILITACFCSGFCATPSQIQFKSLYHSIDK